MYHSNMQSFPTRRSSDLRIRAACPAMDIESRESESRRVESRRSRVESRESTVESRQSRDRKSTRLNSSHVSISYAVFCLKKNKTVLSKYMIKLAHQQACN